MPLVSVVMPSFGHARFVADAIVSVLEQSVDDLELLIIDDASTDDSRLIIERYREADRRVRAVFHDRNLGISRTMNEGVDAARGRFLASIASDDMWERRKLEKQLDVLSRNEDLVVWSDGTIIDSDGRPTGMLFAQLHGGPRRKRSGDIFDELLKGNFILGSSRIVKRANLDGIRRDERLLYLNDYRYAVDLASRYRYHFIEEPLVRYRIHPGNTVFRDLAGYYRDSVVLKRDLLSRYRTHVSLSSRLHIHAYSLNILKKLLMKPIRARLTRLAHAVGFSEGGIRRRVHVPFRDSTSKGRRGNRGGA